jgi:hypothetical protein
MIEYLTHVLHRVVSSKDCSMEKELKEEQLYIGEA